MHIVPKHLKEGDTIAIIGTARARDEEQLKPAKQILTGAGLKIAEGKHLYKKHHQFAGTDNERREDLQWALDHPGISAILIAGGGYGTTRIVDTVNFEAFTKNPKWIIGYSDATVLHARLNRLNTASVHGPLAFQFDKDADSTSALLSLLFGTPVTYPLTPVSLNRNGNAKAELAGGNLSVICSLSGSADDIQTKGKILFIEDIDEQLYNIDRMMLQMKRSGKLKDLAGMIIGGMTDMKDNAVPFGKSAVEIIQEAVEEYNYPLMFEFPAGHGEKNYPLILNETVEMNVNDNHVLLKYPNHVL